MPESHLLEDQALCKEISIKFGSNTKEFSSYLSTSDCVKSSTQFLDPDTTAASVTGVCGTRTIAELAQTAWLQICKGGSAKASKHGTDEHKMHKSTCKLNHACFTDLVLEK